MILNTNPLFLEIKLSLPPATRYMTNIYAQYGDLCFINGRALVLRFYTNWSEAVSITLKDISISYRKNTKKGWQMMESKNNLNSDTYLHAII